MFKIAIKIFLKPWFVLFCAGLVASSVSSNRTGLDMASILQNKLGQKDTDELGKISAIRLKTRK